MAKHPLQGKPELISVGGSPLSSQETITFPTSQRESLGESFEKPYPTLLGDTVLLREEQVDNEAKSASGLIAQAGGRKKLYRLVSIGPEVSKDVPYSEGDYVEAFVKDYTFFTAFDGENYVIATSNSICGYYKKKEK